MAKQKKIDAKETPEIKEESPVIENSEFIDPDWAKESCVDPKTGIHLSSLRQAHAIEQAKKLAAVKNG